MKKLVRGDVWWVDFSASKGSEIRKDRPAVIVSRGAFNKFLNRVQVVACSSKVAKIHPNEASVKIDGKNGKALAHQLHTVTKSRLLRRIGKVSFREIEAIEKAIKVQLCMG